MIDVSSQGNSQKSMPPRRRRSVQQGRSIACCVPEGATLVGARSVLSVREHDKMTRTPLAVFSTFPKAKLEEPAHRCHAHDPPLPVLDDPLAESPSVLSSEPLPRPRDDYWHHFFKANPQASSYPYHYYMINGFF
jgi:hypothetical protein